MVAFPIPTRVKVEPSYCFLIKSVDNEMTYQRLFQENVHAGPASLYHIEKKVVQDTILVSVCFKGAVLNF